MDAHTSPSLAIHDRPATIGDVIGWGCLIPAAGFVFPVFSSGFGLISRLETIFMELGAKLPLATRIALWIGDPWFPLIPFAFILIGVALLISLKTSFSRMMTGICILAATTIYFKFMIMAVFGPLLELQKALT